MAELESTGAEIIPATKGLAETVQGDFGRYAIRVSDYTASGQKDEFSICVPRDERWGDIMLRAAILKRTQFQNNDIPTIIHGIMYADARNLDIMAGDVYFVNGRLATSNKAKIKAALATGMIEGIETEMRVTDTPFSGKGCPLTKDLECTVTITVKGWKKPLIRKALLSRWFKERNPNWVSNPEHMLEMNTVAHACEYVAPGGTEGDEAPPPEPMRYVGEMPRTNPFPTYAYTKQAPTLSPPTLGQGLLADFMQNQQLNKETK